MAISAELLNAKDTSYTPQSRQTNRRGTAFLLEALIVLGFLMASLAVFVQLFAGAQLEAVAAKRLSQAVIAATNRAEEFSADPTDDSDSLAGELEVSCEVVSEQVKAGVIYHATIRVSDTKTDEEVYVLETSRYVSGEGVSER